MSENSSYRKGCKDDRTKRSKSCGVINKSDMVLHSKNLETAKIQKKKKKNWQGIWPSRLNVRLSPKE